MRYVDEFRDPRLIVAAAEEIARLADGRPPLPDHGGVRRAHPLDLPLLARGAAARRTSSWCTARAARSACCRWGAPTTASTLAERPEVILTAFGDVMRVPGTKGSPLRPQGARAPTSAWCTRRSTPCKLAQKQPRPPGGLLRHRVRDHGAFDRAHAARARASSASTTSPSSATTSPSSRRSRRSSTRRTCGSTPSSARATSRP